MYTHPRLYIHMSDVWLTLHEKCAGLVCPDSSQWPRVCPLAEGGIRVSTGRMINIVLICDM